MKSHRCIKKHKSASGLDKLADRLARELISELMQEESSPLPSMAETQCISPEEGCAHILRGLISYHERMTMGNYPERDFYLDALRFALSCVEEKISK